MLRICCFNFQHLIKIQIDILQDKILIDQEWLGTTRDMYLHREMQQFLMDLDFDLFFLLLGWILEVFSWNAYIFVYK